MSVKKHSLNKLHTKVLATALTLLIVVVMSVTVTYAWMTLSINPAISNARVALAGTSTIMLAPDVSRQIEYDGQTVTVHYPGKFSDSLDFADHPETYGFLSTVSGLSPVSTADGINWISATYNEYGDINDISLFSVDRTLENANPVSGGTNGGYICFDFWVVAPDADYNLRVSTDVGARDARTDAEAPSVNREGSSMIELPKAVEDGAALSGFALEHDPDPVTSSARVGFLVNKTTAPSADMQAYIQSGDGYDERFKRLAGVYQTAGNAPEPGYESAFTIYEPNGDMHSLKAIAANDGLANGDYVITSPLGYDADSGLISPADVRSILCVQKQSFWAERNGKPVIDGDFDAQLIGKSGVNVSNAVDKFLNEYIDRQTAPYISSGAFYRDTTRLYMVAGVGSAADVESEVELAGATDGAVITRLTSNVPQRIRMFIWIEGQDIDCVADVQEIKNFILNLELAGES